MPQNNDRHDRPRAGCDEHPAMTKKHDWSERLNELCEKYRKGASYLDWPPEEAIRDLVSEVEREAVAKVVDEEGVMFENGKTFGRGEMLEEVKEALRKDLEWHNSGVEKTGKEVKDDAIQILEALEKLKEQTHG